jgi:hypothetical protein
MMTESNHASKGGFVMPSAIWSMTGSSRIEALPHARVTSPFGRGWIAGGDPGEQLRSAIPLTVLPTGEREPAETAAPLRFQTTTG